MFKKIQFKWRYMHLIVLQSLNSYHRRCLQLVSHFAVIGQFPFDGIAANATRAKINCYEVQAGPYSSRKNVNSAAKYPGLKG